MKKLLLLKRLATLIVNKCYRSLSNIISILAFAMEVVLDISLSLVIILVIGEILIYRPLASLIILCAIVPISILIKPFKITKN
jgi:hypothetical protein